MSLDSSLISAFEHTGENDYVIYKDENGILNAVSKTKDIPNSFAGF